MTVSLDREVKEDNDGEGLVGCVNNSREQPGLSEKIITLGNKTIKMVDMGDRVVFYTDIPKVKPIPRSSLFYLMGILTAASGFSFINQGSLAYGGGTLLGAGVLGFLGVGFSIREHYGINSSRIANE